MSNNREASSQDKSEIEKESKKPLMTPTELRAMRNWHGDYPSQEYPINPERDGSSDHG
jgi:hypothetical protein